jgi:hypothetical protein
MTAIEDGRKFVESHGAIDFKPYSGLKYPKSLLV